MKPDKKKTNGAKSVTPSVIASRRTCKSDGTGLSHYIIMDKKTK